jgi:hypothetical protein
MGMPEWEEIAIPDGFGPFRLLYNPPSDTVIAELRSIGDQFFPNQLYIRKKDSPKYEPITRSDRMVSSESVVTSLERPFLFYLSYGMTKSDAGLRGDWEGLYSFDLQERRHLKILDRNSLQLPSPYVEGWITGLVAVSAAARELYLTVGMLPPKTSTELRKVNHQLVRIDLPGCDIHLITELKGTFF